MTNDYYNNAVNTLTTGEVARAVDVENKFAEIVTAFAKLPGETELSRNKGCFADDAGTVNAYAVTLHQPITAYVDDMEVVFKVVNANTGPCTLNVDGVGSKAIKTASGDDLTSGSLSANTYCACRYDADSGYFVLVYSGDHENRIQSIENSINGALTAGSGCPVSDNDAAAGYLNGKLVAGGGISLTENNDGGDETLSITSTGTPVSSNDTTPGPLSSKLTAGSGISLSESNDGGDETLEISVVENASIKRNLAIAAFSLSVQSGLTVMNMDDGFIDEFHDDTGILIATDIVRDAEGYCRNYNKLFDLGGISYSSFSKSVSAQTDRPVALNINNAGDKMLVVGGILSNKIYEYSISITDRVSTASYVSGSDLDVSAQDNPRDFTLNSDEDKIYMVASTKVYQYDMTAANTLLGATYATGKDLTVSGVDSDPTGVAMTSDDSKLWVLGSTNNLVFQYTLSTHGDLGTASYDSSEYLDISNETTDARCLFIGDGDTKLYILDAGTDELFQYSLSTAGVLSTASYDGVSYDFTTYDSAAHGVCLNDEGSALYMVGQSNDTVYQFTLSNSVIDTTSTLISDAFTASSAPDTAYLVVRQEDVDTVTLNTDLVFSVTRDNGTTWTASTLTEFMDAGERILTATVDISGQPSGTAMKYKAETANSKKTKIHGVSLQWN